MTDQKQTDPDRYTLVIEGVRWEYQGTDAARAWWSKSTAFNPCHTDDMLASRPTHAPAILDIVKRWHEDRMPKTHRPQYRRRVVRCGPTPDNHRGNECRMNEDGVLHLYGHVACGDIHLNELAALNDLAANPWERSTDGGVTWTPCANPDEPEPTDA